MNKIFGIILMMDGLFSLFLVNDKKPLWQVARGMRIGIGFILLYM
jgi:hypothetical protein